MEIEHTSVSNLSTQIPKDEQIHYGVSWYPEMWPLTEWPKDIARMKEVGFTIVRVFEFAWKRFEPTEGVYEFQWALDILDQLHTAGIKVMIGTPTAAPPAWLTSRYPEVLGTDGQGKRKTHGKRKHYNQHSQKYRQFSSKIVTKMAEAFADHPAVHSWQIDNEMGGYDYGEETRKAFHDWLEKKYKSIDNLNRIWGLNFWSQAYDSFDQIPLVTAQLGSRAAPERHHPSLIMALAKFQNEAWTTFIHSQCQIIRQFCNHPITTNMTGAIGGMDWFRHFMVLDRSGASMYSDLSYYHLNFMRFDRLRAEKPNPYWLLETAPNWSGGGPVWNIHHDERGIRAFSWLSILMGGSMVLYWQWRSHWAGQEMQHGTCVSQTGKWMPGKSAWKQIADEFKNVSDFLIENPAQKGPTAIMVDSESSWVFSIDPIHPSNTYIDRIRDDFQLPLQRAFYNRDLIHPSADLSPYKVIVIPHLPILEDPVRAKLEDWVAQGGRLILGPLTGYRSSENTLHTELEYGGLEKLIGACQSMRFSPHWVEEEIEVRLEDGTSSHPRIWCDAFQTNPDTQVLARYIGGYGNGQSAIIKQSFGNGQVMTIGSPIDPDVFIKLFREFTEDTEVQPFASGDGRVVVTPRVDAEGNVSAYGIVNTQKETASIELKHSGKDLLTGDHCEGALRLEPLAVKIVKL